MQRESSWLGVKHGDLVRTWLVGAGKERFAARPDDARVAELQGLRDFASQAVQDLDKKMEGLAAPRERVMKLLQAQDKKGMLLQMQGEGGGSWRLAHSCLAATFLLKLVCVDVQVTMKLMTRCSSFCSRMQTARRRLANNRQLSS